MCKRTNIFNSGSISGRKKSEGEYHEPCERSEFYHMSDLTKRAALFIGPDEYDSRYLDASLTFDPLSELEPIAKRPRPSERGCCTPQLQTFLFWRSVKC